MSVTLLQRKTLSQPHTAVHIAHPCRRHHEHIPQAPGGRAMRQPPVLGASDVPEMPNLQKTGKSGLPGFTHSLTPYQIGNYSQIWQLALLF